MNMVGHHNEGVKLVATFGPIVFEGLEEDFRVPLDLESPCGDCNGAYLRG
jgi:hypothetical protein